MSDSSISGPSDRTSLLRLLDVARQLAAPSDLTEVLGKIINIGREVLEVDRGTIFLFDEGTSELFVKIGTGLKELRFSIENQSIAGECARSRTIINVPDCYVDSRFNKEIDRKTGYRTQSLIAVPLVGLEDQLVGVLQLLNPAKGNFSKVDEQIVTAIASQAAVAIQRARLLEERMIKLKLERDLQLARQIQLNVLPKEVPRLQGYDIASFAEPAEQTGGDIYDLIPAGSSDAEGGQATSLHILLADATGHGIGPALSVTQVRAMMRLGVRLEATLENLISHMNNQLESDLAANRFVTAFVGRLDASNHTLNFHAAGQGPILTVRSATGQCNWQGASTVPMGVLTDIPLDPPDPIIFELGDVLALLTDGFYEYQDPSGAQLGNNRVGQVFLNNLNLSAQQILDALLTELRCFAAGAPQMDDLTAVIIKRRE